MQLQVFIRGSESFDSSTQMKITKTDTDASCVFNRLRLLLNIPTIMEVIKTLQSFDSLIEELSTCKMANIINVQQKLKIMSIFGAKIPDELDI